MKLHFLAAASLLCIGMAEEEANLRGVADTLKERLGHGTNTNAFNFEEQVTQLTANLPRQPIRNYNPMCIGIIGGVGPQAGADVFTKLVDVSSHKNWYYQARDAPAVYVSSSPELDGTTQNDWVWADQNEVDANVGKVLNKITDKFPSCVRDYGVVGLACNTIHDYLHKGLNNNNMFVSIINMVHQAFKRMAEPESNIYVLGSAVTMSDKGEYKVLWEDSKSNWNINEGIPDSDKGWLWDNVILEVQKDNKQLAHDNLKKFLQKYVKDKNAPISLTCTELPIAVLDPSTQKIIEGYIFIDPNEELAKGLVERSEQRLKEIEPEDYAGWKSGIANYEDKCCNTTNTDEVGPDCGLCCEGKDCA